MNYEVWKTIYKLKLKMAENFQISPAKTPSKDASSYKMLQDYCKIVIKKESEWSLGLDNAKSIVKSIEVLHEQINDTRDDFTPSSEGFDGFGAGDFCAVTCSLMAALKIETDKMDLILSNLKKIVDDVKSVLKKVEKEEKSLKSKLVNDVLFVDFILWFEELYFYYRNEYLTREFLIREPSRKLINKWWIIQRTNKVDCKLIILRQIEIFSNLDFSYYSEKENSKLQIKSHNSLIKESGDDSISNLEILNRNTSKNNSFIQEKRFYGVTVEVKLNRSTLKLKNNFDDYFVMISPRVMEDCSVNHSRLVLLTNSSGHQIIRTACLDVKLKDEIGLTMKSLRNFGVKSGEFVVAEAFNGCVKPADRLILKSVGKPKLQKCRNVTKHLKQTEEGKYFTVGNRIYSKYLGNDNEFVVVKINGHNSREIDKSAMDAITKSMKGLNIRTSTPIRGSTEHQKTRIMKVKDDKQFFSVTSETKLFVEKCDFASDDEDKLKFENLGGLSESIEILQKLVTDREHSNSRIHTSIGVLIHGPPGVGKTILARTVAAENKLFSFMNIDGTIDIVKKHFGESESSLFEIFEEAKIRSPTIILLDNIDHWCPEKSNGTQGIRITNTLMTEMKNLQDCDETVIVLATTSKIYNVDPSLRRPGVFEYEIEIGMPSPQQREDILIKLLNLCDYHNLSQSDINKVAEVTHGFTACDLNALMSEAFKIANQKILNEIHSSSNSSKFNLNDILSAVRQLPITCMRELAIQNPNIKWSDIGGQSDIKLKIKQSVEWPIQHPEIFQRLGIRPIRGILLYGPPGCSKTLMAKAVATESGLNFISINVTDVYSKFVGESEQAVRDLFHAARRAAPSVLFIDEIDALVSKRGSGGNLQRRILSQLLFEMDSSIHLHMTVVIAATNRPDLLDEALTRPGRFDRLIYVPLPDPETRREIFKLQLAKLNFDDSTFLDLLVQKSHYFSGAEIADICNNVITRFVMKIDSCLADISYQEFLTEVEKRKPSTSKNLIKFCEEFKRRV